MKGETDRFRQNSSHLSPPTGIHFSSCIILLESEPSINVTPRYSEQLHQPPSPLVKTTSASPIKIHLAKELITFKNIRCDHAAILLLECCRCQDTPGARGIFLQAGQGKSLTTDLLTSSQGCSTRQIWLKPSDQVQGKTCS